MGWPGKNHNGNVLLIEAKAHISEMKSPASLASTLSLRLIHQSLNEVKAFLDIDSSTDWAGTYYQYTNRIAHLYLLRELNQIPAYLIFLCFLNDKDMKGPKRIEEWQTEIHNLESYLSLPSKHKLSDYILHVYLDITQLQQG